MIGSIGDKIREKIEKEHIVPESRFKIETEKLLYWGVVLLAALLSGVGFSFIVLHVSQFFSPFGHMMPMRPPVSFLLYTFPYVWLVLSGVLVILGVYVIKRAPKGYRYHTSFLFVIVASGAFLLALSFHFSRVNERAEQFVIRQMPNGFAVITEKQWNHPEEGLLAGRVQKVAKENFEVQVQSGNVFRVVVNGNTVFYGKRDVATGNFVMVHGEKERDRVVVAETVKIIEVPQSTPLQPSHEDERSRRYDQEQEVE